MSDDTLPKGILEAMALFTWRPHDDEAAAYARDETKARGCNAAAGSVGEGRAMIVKVQQSLSRDRVLIYDKGRGFTYEGELTREIADFMGDNLKVYARASYNLLTKRIELHKRVSERSW